MEEVIVSNSSNLIERLENQPGAINKNNPFYWYLHLEMIGKRAQTDEMVNEAVNNFNVDNHSYKILKMIAKKYITPNVCRIAVTRNGLNLKYVPKEFRDVPMCLSAVKSDGGALEDVPEQILLGEDGYEICVAAVCNDFHGRSLSNVPACYLCGEKGKVLCESAVKANGYAIEFVPTSMMTKDLVTIAIGYPLPSKVVRFPDGSYRKRRAYRNYQPVLSLVPKKYLSEKLVALSAHLYPESLQYAPAKYVSRDLCLELIEQDPMNLQYVPNLDATFVSQVIKTYPRAIMAVPELLLTFQLCRDALHIDPTIPIDGFPDFIRTELEKEFQPKAFIDYEAIALDTPAPTKGSKWELPTIGKERIYDLSVSNDFNDTIYYITDIHLEHQLVESPFDIIRLSESEIRECIRKKISELLSSVPDKKGILLIGGDVADSIKLTAAFYKELSSFRYGWRGKIYAVLGNHELWDGNPMGQRPARTVDEIITDYRNAMPRSIKLLENELLINYKGLRRIILREQTILNSSIEELTQVCANSTFILLGGIGFSGLNPIYNAAKGLYRKTVSPEEDISRSIRFRVVYEKILASAGNLRVIVMTHTQMEDWSDMPYNPNWIYISGHTHQNKFILQQDGPTVLSDNQVGYKPVKWHLNGFTIDVKRYDPFQNLPDGIHKIEHEQYIEFNRCQGIYMESLKSPGNIYALKYNGIYMFVLENDIGLYLLEGGRRHKLNYGINYYFDNLPAYIQKVQYAFTPYQKALSMISDEIKKIGGVGSIHGCIVDLDIFNHVYLNPFDGKITPYFAFNTTEKMVFTNIEALLKSSPVPPSLDNGASILDQYLEMSKENKLPILSHNTNEKWELATVPQVVLDKEMYKPSNLMRSIQYIFDQNIIRIWNDAILKMRNGIDAANSFD